MTKSVSTPLSDATIQDLACGDEVLLSGTIYTARDAAHKRLCALIEQGKDLPIDLRGQIIYYVGPTPARPGQIIGSAGPTTSSRMDRYAPLLIEKAGLRGMIGKGDRGPGVVEAMKKHGAVYLAAVGGAGALLGKCIMSSKIVCYDDLATEAIRRLEVERLPVVVAVDSTGKSLYEVGPSRWRTQNSSPAHC